ncbi:MAG TPA: hypothetical protein VHC72_00355, partial [Bryobacteraceae bacterium]|nr:hypothetical protein [Bryobacteraceae bacterium]
MKPTAIASVVLLAAGMASAQQPPAFDPSSFVVIGEGLAAGMADFSLRDIYQDKSFPAQMARQMNVPFPQPLIQPPGIGNVPGFQPLPVRLPGVLQGSVREPFPPTADLLHNISIPGARLVDAMTREPGSPLIQPKDPQQTMVNMILGYPALIAGTSIPLLTQTEYAILGVNPTFVLVELGYYDVLSAAVADNPAALPDTGVFLGNYANLIRTLKSKGAKVLVTTIPDPFDTAYFSTMTEAAA